MMICKFEKILVTTLVTMLVTSAQANTTACIAVAQDNLAFVTAPVANLAEQAAANYSSPNITAYKKYENLKRLSPQIARSETLNRAVSELLQDESLSTFHDLLTRVATRMEKKFTGTGITGFLGRSQLTSRTDAGAVMAELRAEIREELVKFMPESMANERSAIILSEQLNKSALMRALGHMTHQESVVALIGPNGINAITPDSLVGRYIRESAAAGKNVASTVASFATGPQFGRGPQRLFISVDSQTTDIADRIFGQNPHFLIHDHGPRQGTLHMHHNGQSVSYSKYDRNAKLATLGRSVNSNTLAPLIVLSSIEASNTQNYFTLGSLANKYAKYPWGLKNIEGETEENYCRTGGYGSCTHWIGEMAIGERNVDRLTMPGFVGDDRFQHGNNLEAQDTSRGLRVAPVGTYNSFKSRDGNVVTIGNTTRVDRLTRMVWTEGQSREQLWSLVLGDLGSGALGRGEFANPGWTAYAFLGKAKADRVPVVLVYRDNAAEPMDQNVLDDMKRTINQQ